LEDVKYNLGIIQEELDALKEEMRTLRQKVELLYFYHNQMEEFNNLKMKYAFMKA
jgi:hypothetical protein